MKKSKAVENDHLMMVKYYMDDIENDVFNADEIYNLSIDRRYDGIPKQMINKIKWKAEFDLSLIEYNDDAGQSMQDFFTHTNKIILKEFEYMLERYYPEYFEKFNTYKEFQ